MDEFYQKTYLMIVFKWSYYYTRKNMKNVRCDIIEDTKDYHTVRFYLKNRVAFLTVWHNGIIEEQITDEEGKEIYFYLHYTLKSLSQFLSYYRDFMVVFLRDADPKRVKVGIVDQDGFSSSYLISLMKESLIIEKSNLEVESVSLSSLEEVEGELILGKHSRVHKSIFSSRSDLKALNTKLQNYVTHVLEPLMTMSYSLGNEYPHGPMETIWKLLFENAAHDSIGSCISDTANEDVYMRYKQVRDIADALV